VEVEVSSTKVRTEAQWAKDALKSAASASRCFCHAEVRSMMAPDNGKKTVRLIMVGTTSEDEKKQIVYARAGCPDESDGLLFVFSGRGDSVEIAEDNKVVAMADARNSCVDMPRRIGFRAAFGAIDVEARSSILSATKVHVVVRIYSHEGVSSTQRWMAQVAGSPKVMPTAGADGAASPSSAASYMRGSFGGAVPTTFVDINPATGQPWKQGEVNWRNGIPMAPPRR
jgi:hypothetical protein